MKGKLGVRAYPKIDRGSFANRIRAPTVLKILAEVEFFNSKAPMSCVSHYSEHIPYLLHHRILPLVRLDAFLYLFDNFCCISDALRFKIVALGFFFAKYHHLKTFRILFDLITGHR